MYFPQNLSRLNHVVSLSAEQFRSWLLPQSDFSCDGRSKTIVILSKTTMFKFDFFHITEEASFLRLDISILRFIASESIVSMMTVNLGF